MFPFLSYISLECLRIGPSHTASLSGCGEFRSVTSDLLFTSIYSKNSTTLNIVTAHAFTRKGEKESARRLPLCSPQSCHIWRPCFVMNIIRWAGT